MPTVQVRFAGPLHERFIQECEKREITPSEFIRKAVEAMMDRLESPHFVPSYPQSTNQASGMVGDHSPPSGFQSGGIRGFALDGTPLTTKAQDRLKGKK